MRYVVLRSEKRSWVCAGGFRDVAPTARRWTTRGKNPVCEKVGGTVMIISVVVRSCGASWLAGENPDNGLYSFFTPGSKAFILVGVFRIENDSGTMKCQSPVFGVWTTRR